MFRCGDVVYLGDFVYLFYLVLGAENIITNLNILNDDTYMEENEEEFVKKTDKNLRYVLRLIGCYDRVDKNMVQKDVSKQLEKTFDMREQLNTYAMGAQMTFLYHSKSFSSYLVKNKLVNKNMIEYFDNLIIESEDLTDYYKTVFCNKQIVKNTKIVQVKKEDIQAKTFYLRERKGGMIELLYVIDKCEQTYKYITSVEFSGHIEGDFLKKKCFQYALLRQLQNDTSYKQVKYATFNSGLLLAPVNEIISDDMLDLY